MKTTRSTVKMFRKNIDLDNQTVFILQMEATKAGYGTLKPFLEEILKERAGKVMKDYARYLDNLTARGKKTK